VPSRGRVAALAVAALLLGSCSSPGSDGAADEPASEPVAEASEETAIYPGSEWDRADPADLGFDPATLDELAAEAEATNSNCLIVVRHGQVAGEWYWNDTTETSSQEVYSATKSYSSTLVGIAQAEGLLDIDDPASEYIPEWAGTPSEDVTIRNLISNDSGRHWDFEGDYLGLTSAPDRDRYAVGLSQDAPPGTVWVYNNAAIQTLDAVLQEATGQDTASFARERLFEPIGMVDSEMTTDEAGNASTYFGLHSTCQDMARFGYLFLREGNWDGTQVVPQEWVEEATQPSQDINTGYGYLWWLNGPAKSISAVQPTTAEEAAQLPDREGPPGTDENMFWAVGLGGQIIQVDPGSDTVVVRLGPGDVAARYGPGQTAQFVTEALTDP
jgi:CubicO group peptidase (beta-lactamase class C family)